MASSSNHSSDNINFIAPPEASVFYPNEEEFQNPLEYISKIHSIAEETGICKIVPPKNWKNPFSLDVDNFKFSARIQKLHLLDGKIRMKINFLEQITQFWELQGIPLIVPELQDKALDVYELYRITREHYSSPKKIKWKYITKYIGFQPDEDSVATVKQCFDNILVPFLEFNKLCEVSCNNDSFKSEVYEIESSDDDDVCIIENDSNLLKEEVDLKPQVYRELKRLRFLGAGPKMNDCNSAKRRRRQKKEIKNKYVEVPEYTCCGCGKVSDSSILVCSNCKDEYHFECIKPSLPSLPEGNWHCYKCVAMDISKPMNDFGFEQAREECNLHQFGEMADTFKSNHFKMPVNLVSCEAVEKEYWKIVSNIDSDVTVRYGADLHTVDNGSGFPTSACANLEPGDAEYAQSGWNLNNLPVLKNSLLRYINSDVSGMKIPWMYVGMCFATFCWHNEDHWMFSINYVHWGQPKTWYGVPGKNAEAFENAMKQEFPELFEAQPDLLHQLVTIMNPNILMKANVPVYKLDQKEGEFVITFPRSYHMGFNQGFNFAEAVNFAPIDWLKFGRESVLNYAQLKRFCVFSHDELLCTIASTVENLSPLLASAIHSDMKYLIEKEDKLRKQLFNDGITNSYRVELELLPDDKRHCDVCKTTCYLSALSCICKDDIVVCLEHYIDLCKCCKSKKVLKYRYTLDEMQQLLVNIERILNSYNEWLQKVENAINQNTTKSLVDIGELLKEADSKEYPNCLLYKSLTNQINNFDSEL